MAKFGRDVIEQKADAIRQEATAIRERRCPKCSTVGGQILYVQERGECPDAWQFGCVERAGVEHLHLICRTCGYRCATDCDDAKG